MVTVETPELRDLSTSTPKTPVSETVKVKEAGEGAIAAPNPFESWLPRYDSPEAYDQAFPSKTEQKAAQVAEAAPGSAAPKSKATGSAAAMLERAKSFIGTPYKWGGSGPLGFDCSGFTQYLYRELGIELPRVSSQQANYGKRIGLDQLRPGDLVAWDNSSRNNGADHIAIYIGNGQVIHAPKPGDAVKISKIWDAGRAWGVAMNL